MSKSATAFRTISEVADLLTVPKHVLRFWELKFPQIKPMKRGGGRRYYRPEDLELLRGIRHLLHAEGYTIKGVQKILREQGIETVKSAPPDAAEHAETAPEASASPAKTQGRSKAAAKDAASPRSRAAKKDATPARSRTKLKADATTGPDAMSDAVQKAIEELEHCRELLLSVSAEKPAIKPMKAAKPRKQPAAKPRKKAASRAARG